MDLSKEELYQQGLKKCTKCGKIKELSEFNNYKRGYMNLFPQCKSCVNEYDKQYQEKHGTRAKRDDTDIAKDYRKKYREEHKEEARKYGNKYKYDKFHRDNFFRIKHNISCRLSKLIDKAYLNTSTLELIGCSREELLNHLESQFVNGMTWDNYGPKGWHVDHILPIISFNMFDIEEIKKACHYTNLQPLWWYDNLSKGSKIINKNE